MRLTSVIVVLAGLGVAGASGYAAKEMLNGQLQAQREAQKQAEEASTVSVIVAAIDIGFGEKIEAGNITTIKWPREAVPAGTFADATNLLPQNGAEPRRALRAIAQGELILANRVGGFGEKVTIVQTLAPNHRAMAITVSAETGVGGFVTPGDFVDVILTQGSGDEMRTGTILQNVRVVGVDQDSNEQNDQVQVARTVTLEVTPDEGQKIAMAQRAGTLSLSLRNLTEEVADQPLEPIRLSDLLNERPEPVIVPEAPAVAPAPPPKRSITVRRGLVTTEETF